jgi:GNAT superfamily N-acetyltransferase
MDYSEKFDISYQIEDSYSDTARELFEKLDQELHSRYPDLTNIYDAKPNEIRGDRGILIVARYKDTPVGCGAFRRLDEDTVEIKRMYVAPEGRRKEIARQLLHLLEAEAIHRGCSIVKLETGTEQHEAIKLYESEGFLKIPCFGMYATDPYSLCYEKSLA